jgi:DNA-binding NarL/FixJ family response regulator
MCRNETADGAAEVKGDAGPARDRRWQGGVQMDRLQVDRVQVSVFATDPISRAGVAGQLRVRPELEVLPEAAQDGADVVVAVVDSTGEEGVRALRQVRRSGPARIVLVAAEVDAADLGTAIECGAVGIVRRSEATSERLVQAITAAARGEGTVPADLLGRLLEQVGRLQRQVLNPRGLAFTGLAQREVAVLRLVADGHDTAEIARTLSYSERTVKNILHDVMVRLQLRNRSHAVAYALREGLI